MLDAGTGIRRLGQRCCQKRACRRRVDLLLTHLHMDHIQGLGFFAPLYDERMDVHIWGPSNPGLSLHARLGRYLSPPFFPVHLRDLACRLTLHEVPCGEFAIGPFRIDSALVCHPGPTVGYRIECARRDRSPIFPTTSRRSGRASFPLGADWTSGFALARGVDLLIHDAQYSAAEYRSRVGWGHSATEHALRFAELAGARHLVAFHHDPAHNDDDVERMLATAVAALHPPFPVTAAAEGTTFEIGGAS